MKEHGCIEIGVSLYPLSSILLIHPTASQKQATSFILRPLFHIR
jgi:hypothetical protein